MKQRATVKTGAAVRPPDALAMYVSQPTAYPGYPAFLRFGCEIAAAGAAADAAVALQPVLYTGPPAGNLRGKCHRVLFSPLIGLQRNFLTGLRSVATGTAGLILYVGDCKKHYLNPGETGRTLVAVQGGPEPHRPGYLLIFVLRRRYARQRPGFNATCAQQFFRGYVRPQMAAWLRLLPNATGETQLSAG